ncbi:WD40 repeat-like protein, partial [Suillus brevipes Sb2]
TIQQWNCNIGLLVGEPLEGDGGSICAPAVPPDGKTIACGKKDRSAQRWDAERSKAVPRRFRSHPVHALACSPSGDRIASGWHKRIICIWDTKTDKRIVGPEARGVRKETVILVVVSRDGRWVLTGGGSRYLAELKACEVETGIVKTFEGHSDWITCIDISADNTRLVSGSLDKTGWIWSSEAGRLVAGPFESVDKVGMVRFSPNSKKLAVKSDWATCLEVCRDVESQKLEIRLGIARMATIFAPSPVFWDNNRSAIDTKRIIPKQTGLRPAGPVISECN